MTYSKRKERYEIIFWGNHLHVDISPINLIFPDMQVILSCKLKVTKLKSY